MPLLSIEEARAKLVIQGWTNRALAEWWSCTEEYVSKIINNPARKRHFDDSIRALPKFSDVIVNPVCQSMRMIDMSPGEKFFRGMIREPGGQGEKVVVSKATKALAERIATKEASKLGWDWFVEHCRVDGEGDEQVITVIEQWSSLADHEIFETR